MRLFLILFALLALPAPLHAQVRLAPEAEALWVPFELTRGNQIRFTMRLNDLPATAILDTGVSDTIMSSAFAARAGLKTGAPARAQAIGGAVDVRWAAIASLQIGGLTRRGGRVGVAPFGSVATGGGTPVDLLVGADLLACCALDIDYDARRFRILPSGRLPFRGATVPLALGQEPRAYVSELRLGARRLRPVIVDTGDGAMVTLSRVAWAATGIRPPAITSTIAFGLGGPIETDLAILPDVQLGTFSAREVEVRVEGEAGFSARTGTMGRIGSGLLQRYRVLLDPGAKRMVLAPGRRVDTPPTRSTSGLLLAYEKGQLRTLHVMRNSPAAAAGWKAGDRICAIDGAPVPPRAAELDAEWTAGAPGRVMRLGMCDGAERQLELKRFY
jgi:hypothetical protein